MSLLQHHNLNASILWCSAFFMVQLSHLYMTIGKATDLTIWTFVDKAMSLLFNMLSRFVIPFLPRSKCLLISWLQSASTVILEPKKIICPCFHCFPIYLPWSDGAGCHDLSFLNVVLSQLLHSAFSPSSGISLWIVIKISQRIILADIFYNMRAEQDKHFLLIKAFSCFWIPTHSIHWKQIEIRMVKSSLVKNQMTKVQIWWLHDLGKIAISLSFSFLFF